MKNKPWSVLFIFFLIIIFYRAEASHNRGGEITYKHISGFEWEITITTYTKTSSISADRPEIDSVHFGDGTIGSITRDTFIDLPSDTRINRYVGNHIYPGSGSYLIYFIDPNWVSDICNIPNSFFTPVCFQSLLIISGCPNNSVYFDSYPMDYAQVHKTCRHNVAAINDDHDSISFELIPPPGVIGYTLPVGIYINPISGQIVCDSVYLDTVCMFALAVKITDWKHGFIVGFVVRLFTYHVYDDPDKNYSFSNFSSSLDTAGQMVLTTIPNSPVTFSFDYTDDQGIDSVHVYGESMHLLNAPITTFTPISSDTISQITTWTPDSTNPRSYPYIFTYRAVRDIRKADFTVLVYVSGQQVDSCYSIGVDELNYQNHSVTLFPNPADGNCFMKCDWIEKVGLITIYNSEGRLVWAESMELNNENVVEIDTRRFACGLYLVKLAGINQFACSKISVEH